MKTTMYSAIVLVLVFSLSAFSAENNKSLRSPGSHRITRKAITKEEEQLHVIKKYIGLGTMCTLIHKKLSDVPLFPPYHTIIIDKNVFDKNPSALLDLIADKNTNETPFGPQSRVKVLTQDSFQDDPTYSFALIIASKPSSFTDASFKRLISLINKATFTMIAKDNDESFSERIKNTLPKTMPTVKNNLVIEKEDDHGKKYKIVADIISPKELPL